MDRGSGQGRFAGQKGLRQKGLGRMVRWARSGGNCALKVYDEKLKKKLGPKHTKSQSEVAGANVTYSYYN